MEFVLDCYCCVFCGACPVMLATQAGTIDADQQCYGCKSEKPTGYCTASGIKTCALHKGFEFCIQCESITTCSLMEAFTSDVQYPYGQCVLKNMEMIQTTGLQNWLEDQEKRWRCEHCGEPHSWYDETCPKCGLAVINYLEDL